MDGHHVLTEKCSACGNCVTVCPEQVIEKDAEGKARFTADGARWCIRCGHCMAICPEEAVVAGGLSYAKDFRPLPDGLADAAAFEALLARRRSVRRFKPAPVERALLERIVEMVSLAPMGFPPHKVRLTIVGERAKIEQGLPAMVKMYQGLNWMMKRAPLRLFFRLQMDAAQYKMIAGFLLPRIERALPGMKEGRDYITHGAPAMILFHAPKDAESWHEDGDIAMTYAALAAHALGLGATIIGLVPPVVHRDRGLRTLYGIPDGDRVFGCVILGHPAVKFAKRAIRREMAGVRWA